ncbi:MAG: hypothetical protein SGCHY_003791 [Lobulomycetales sp.]
MSNAKRTGIAKKPILNTAACKYDIIEDCGQEQGFRIEAEDAEGTNWSIYWIDTGVAIERVLNMQQFQKINHFPGMRVFYPPYPMRVYFPGNAIFRHLRHYSTTGMHEICRKDYLARNLGRLGRLFPKDYNFFPKTWILPSDFTDFKQVSASQKNTTYIAKPDHGCQGKGIYLFKKPSQLLAMSETDTPDDMIVQNYLSRPLLIDGYKFDLRVYVLITSVDPLRVFIYKDGLARFATETYKSPEKSNIQNLHMHLTNYAINKSSDNFDWDERTSHGSKRTIQSVMNILKANGLNTDRLWSRISDVILKTIITIQPAVRKTLKACLKTERDPNNLFELGSQCFEILGFDIFIDSKLKPWLLEVNHSPSFNCDSSLDRKIKEGVVSDTLRMVSLEPEIAKRFQKEQKAKSQSRLFHSKAARNSTSSPPEEATTPRNSSPAPTSASNTPAPSPLPPKPTSDTKKAAASSSEQQNVKTTEKSKNRMQALDSDTIDRLLQAYHQSYPETLLEKISSQENDRGLGDFERIFPPNEPTKLAQYLKCIETVEEFFGDNVASKRRKEYIFKKKQEELEKKRAAQDLKIMNERRIAKVLAQRRLERKSLSSAASNVSSPNVSLRKRPLQSAKVRYTALQTTLSLPENIGEPSVNDSTGSLENYDERRKLQRSRSARIYRPIREKGTLKINVESINDRFVSSLLHQEISGIPIGMASIPSSVSSQNLRIASLFQNNQLGRARAGRNGQNKSKPTLTPLTDARRKASQEQLLQSRLFAFEL